jgi:hypothetical protein
VTPPPRPSRFLEAASAALILASLALAPRAARAQACCVGTGLVTPARLRVFEDYGAGVQTHVRSVLGSFDAGGDYVRSPPGADELDLEQDLFGAMRIGRFQVALKLPFLETGRRETGVSAFGGGVGDVSASLRYDVIYAGDRPWWPGIAILAGLSAPTGRTVEESGDPTAATGIGSFEGNLGLSVEQVIGRSFVSATAFLSQQASRTVGTVTQSFGPRVTAILAGGYVLANELTLGGFVQATRRSDQALVTAGAAAALPLGDYWRVQGTLSGDVPLSGWGHLQTTGAGLTVSLLRVWL